jgi:hypothetical protein
MPAFQKVGEAPFSFHFISISISILIPKQSWRIGETSSQATTQGNATSAASKPGTES